MWRVRFWETPEVVRARLGLGLPEYDRLSGSGNTAWMGEEVARDIHSRAAACGLSALVERLECGWWGWRIIWR